MSTLFFDGFNRADGAIGNGWQTLNGAGGISGGAIRGTSFWWHCIRAGELPGTQQRVQVKVATVPAGGPSFGLFLRQHLTLLTAYKAIYTVAADGITATIVKIINGTTTTLDVGDKILCTPTGSTVAFEADGSNLRAYVNGDLSASASDSANPSNVRFGFQIDSAGLYLDDFLASLPGESTFTAIATAPVLVGLPWTIALSNTYGGWTAGDPGAPTFTVDSGTVQSQSVESANSATLQWVPTVNVSTLTITDPTTARSATCTLGDGLGSGSAGIGLTQTAIDWLNQSAAVLPGLIPGAGTTFSVMEGGVAVGKTLGDLLYDLWLSLWYVAPPTGGVGILDKMYYAINGAVDPFPLPTLADDTGATLSLATTIDATTQAIRTPGNLDLQSILDALNALPPPDYTTVLQAIASVGALNLEATTDLYALMRGVTESGGLTLRTLLTAINTIHTSDAPAILQAIRDVRGAGNVDLSQLLALLGGDGVILGAIAAQTVLLEATHAAILAAIAGLGAGEGIDLAAILAALGPLAELVSSVASLASTIGGIVPSIKGTDSVDLTHLEGVLSDYYLDLAARIRPVPPIWPGLAGVILGAPVALTGPGRINGPMDGVLVTITDRPASKPKREVDGVQNIKWLGYLAFRSDNGQEEASQWLGWESAVYAPCTLLQAEALMVYLEAGVAATVTPWVLTSAL